MSHIYTGIHHSVSAFLVWQGVMLDAFSFDFYEMNIQTGQTRKWVLLPLHFSVSPQIKSLFNLSYNLTIVLKHFMEKRFKDLFIRLLVFSVSKCNAFIEKEAVTSCRLHHFLGNLTYSIYFLLFFPPPLSLEDSLFSFIKFLACI